MLFFPVKSLKKVFAYITCPLVLNRYVEDLRKIDAGNSKEIAEFVDKLVPKDEEAIIFSDELEESGHVVLEEYAFKSEKVDKSLPPQLLTMFDSSDFRRDKISKHLVILSDTDFTHFIKHSTEIVPRIRIDKETGTAQGQALRLCPAEPAPQSPAPHSFVARTR